MDFTINVKIMDPEVWVSQIQGPLSMELLSKLIEGSMPNPWNYFDWAEVMIGGQKVIISRTGFTNELGWEIYIRPENDIEKLGDLILESGKSLGMILTATPGFRQGVSKRDCFLLEQILIIRPLLLQLGWDATLISIKTISLVVRHCSRLINRVDVGGLVSRMELLCADVILKRMELSEAG